MTQRSEVTEAVEAFVWESLESPQKGEMIYRRGPMLVFAQYDRDGGLRQATLRRIVGSVSPVTTEVAHVDWRDRIKVGKVMRWLSEYGESATEAAELARRRRARQ
jgi:hypothetical protein